TSELDRVFDVLTGAPNTFDFECLMVAPFDLRTRFIELIDREAAHARAGRPAGMRIEMAVRGVCALTPCVPGLSDNIRIVSVVGLLLQHARIFHFTNGGDD